MGVLVKLMEGFFNLNIFICLFISGFLGIYFMRNDSIFNKNDKIKKFIVGLIAFSPSCFPVLWYSMRDWLVSGWRDFTAPIFWGLMILLFVYSVSILLMVKKHIFPRIKNKISDSNLSYILFLILYEIYLVLSTIMIQFVSVKLFFGPLSVINALTLLAINNAVAIVFNVFLFSFLIFINMYISKKLTSDAKSLISKWLFFIGIFAIIISLWGLNSVKPDNYQLGDSIFSTITGALNTYLENNSVSRAKSLIFYTLINYLGVFLLIECLYFRLSSKKPIRINSIFDKINSISGKQNTDIKIADESFEEKLRRLNSLKADGIINDDEFQSKKADILKEI